MMTQRSGLDVIGELPWGTHFCQFYQTRKDLLEVLVGYFQQGLQNNEFCLWITSEPLRLEDANQALRAVVPDLDERIRQGQIEFHDYRQWYFPDGEFDAERLLQRCVEKERAALARGYEGMRLTGNASWLEKDNWKVFTDYETTVSAVIGTHRMLVLCTYPFDKCKGVEMFDVLRNHPLALVRRMVIGKSSKVQSIGRPRKRCRRASGGKRPSWTPSPIPLGSRTKRDASSP